MKLWMAGFAVVICLTLLALVAKNLKSRIHNAQISTLYEAPLRVVVTDVQTKQGWRYEEAGPQNSYNNTFTRLKIWQTYYIITAQWSHPLTKQTQPLCWAVWSDYLLKKPAIGDILLVAIDSDDPGATIYMPIDQLKIVKAEPCKA